MQLPNSISLFGVFILVVMGIALTWLTWRKEPSKQRRERVGKPAQTGRLRKMGQSLPRDLDRLFVDISRGLRALAAPNGFGGMGLTREKQAEVRRLLFELQRRLRLLEDGARDKYEAKAHRILAQAARFDITLPPP